MSSVLFTPIELGGLGLANRIIIAPMCQYSASEGRAEDWHLIHYGHMAFSGAGLLIFEATAVSPEGRISSFDLGLWSDETEKALDRIVRGVRGQSRMPLSVQLGHAGRKASHMRPWEGGGVLPKDKGGWQTVAPSALPYDPSEEAPLALDDAGLARIKTAFADAAQRSARLGFDAVEIHAAHGYLLHQFLSPIANRRTDAYGGSLEKRMRFPLEVFDAVQKAFGGPVGIRISGTDWTPGGWQVEDSIAFSAELKKRGCVYVHVSGGGLSPLQELNTGPGYQVGMAERIQRETGLAAIAVGLITEPEQAETIVASGQAAMVALGRGMLYDPRWPWHAAARLNAKVDAPPQYWRSQPHLVKGLFG